MSQKTRFPLDTQPKDQPINHHPFYRWLVENERTLDTRGAGILSQYLDHLGFVVTQHTLDPEVLDELRLVQDFYGWNWMPTREPKRMSDLFVASMKGEPRAFWLRGVPGASYVMTTPEMEDLIEETSPIYELSPQHYYFEVINGVLFIKYQHIIGSRRICPIKEAS